MTLIMPALVSSESVFAAFEMERPSYSETNIGERVENANSNNEASVGIGVHVAWYVENPDPSILPFSGRDGFCLKVAGTANTRKGIAYDPEVHSGMYYDISPQTGTLLNLGDDNGAWVDLPFEVAFYSGPGLQDSSLYSRVWVCSNGFLCFTSNATSPNPQNFPDPTSPNAVIAPYWSDLNPSGGTIRYYIETTTWYTLFVVSWYNVLDKANGQLQTFQVIIKSRTSDSVPATRDQNWIYFQYQTVSWSGKARLGLEDQEGYKGSGSGVGPGSGYTIQWRTTLPCFAPEIRELKITVEKEDNEGEIYIDSSNWSLSGSNLQWKDQEPAPEPYFSVALEGTATLLMSHYLAWLLGPTAGLLWDGAVIVYETVEAYSRSLWKAKEMSIKDHANTTESLAYVSVPAAGSNPAEYPVDATLGAQVYWVFDETGADQNHALKVTVELKYYSYDTGQIESVTTSVNLNIVPDAGNRINDPNVRSIGCGVYKAFLCPVHDTSDFYEITVHESGKMVEVWLKPPSDADYDLYLYDRNKIQLGYSTNRGNGVMEWIAYAADPLGDCYIEARYYAGCSGKYELDVSTYDYEGGCPFLYAWNGKDYVIDNNLLPTSARSSGMDVEDFYRLEQTSVPVRQNPLLSFYSFQISEFQTEHSYLDQVKLLAVDHQPDVNVAVAQDGEILTYRNPHPPVSCTNKYGYNMLNRIQYIDQEYYQGFPDDYLLLDFGNLSIREGAKLVMRADALCKDSIHVQILNETGEWQTVAKIIPRAYWATEIVNLAPYLPNSTSNLQIRLYFTAFHKLDYVGLDTTPQADVTTRQAILISAMHSEQGSVTLKLLFNDQKYAELVPNQQISLLFAMPRKQNPTTTTTLIFYTEGHYNTIK
jgi:hypothetical protein